MNQCHQHKKPLLYYTDGKFGCTSCLKHAQGSVLVLQEVMKQITDIVKTSGFCLFPKQRAMLMGKKDLLAIRREQLRFQQQSFNRFVDSIYQRVRVLFQQAKLKAKQIIQQQANNYQKVFDLLESKIQNHFINSPFYNNNQKLQPTLTILEQYKKFQISTQFINQLNNLSSIIDSKCPQVFSYFDLNTTIQEFQKLFKTVNLKNQIKIYQNTSRVITQTDIQEITSSLQIKTQHQMRIKCIFPYRSKAQHLIGTAGMDGLITFIDPIPPLIVATGQSFTIACQYQNRPTIITGSLGKAIKFWSINENNKIINKKKQIWLEGSIVKTLAGCGASLFKLLPQLGILLSASKKYIIKWQLNKQNNILFEQQIGNITCLQCKGQQFATGTSAGYLSFYQISNQKPFVTKELKQAITSLKLTTHLLVGSQKGSIFIFDFKDGLLIKSIENLFEKSPIRKMQILDDRYALASSRNKLRIFNPISSQVIKQLKFDGEISWMLHGGLWTADTNFSIFKYSFN